MKKVIFRIANLVAGVAFLVTVFNINTCCSLYAYQPELPEDIDDLCKY